MRGDCFCADRMPALLRFCYRGKTGNASRRVATGGISVYIPQISLPYKFLCGYWLFFLFDPGQIR